MTVGIGNSPVIGGRVRDRSELLEILAMFPIGHPIDIGALVGILVQPRLISTELAPLHRHHVVDELGTESRPEELVLFQNIDGFNQRLGQSGDVRGVRVLVQRTGIGAVPDAVQTHRDLGGHVEVGVRAGLADPVFHMRDGLRATR